MIKGALIGAAGMLAVCGAVALIGYVSFTLAAGSSPLFLVIYFGVFAVLTGAFAGAVWRCPSRGPLA